MTEQKTCVACGRSSAQIPLVTLEYNGEKYYICPQDFPVLIHQPERLVGMLPGVEHLEGHKH